jgi:DNA mismatch endonuclease, patch repair protein
MKTTQPTPERSANMRAIKSRDTGPELIVRRIARTVSPGYRLHRKDIPGSPDLAWIGAKRAVFVHGCFWHGHECKNGSRVPKENRDYWVAKVAGNRARDARNLAALKERGWRALVIWECELKPELLVRQRLAAFLAVTTGPRAG